MEFSSYNIVFSSESNNKYFIINPLSGNADLLDEETYRGIKENKTNSPLLVEKGYVVDPASEKKLFRKKYLDFLDERERDEIQLFFVTNYSCNFNCSYCYQSCYNPQNKKLTFEVVDSFFDYARSRFGDKQKYITLFGGEPLLGSPAQKDIIGYIAGKAHQENIELSVVTNGYHLAEYLDILAKAKIREIQVTLDGTEEVHDKRRPLKNGKGTFQSIVEGIDNALSRSIPINLRVVVDKENISNLPDLADFAIKKGWTRSGLLKTQLGRNYELHECQTNKDKLYTRLELYEELFGLIQQNPHFVEFHKPAFSISKFLFEQGELPSPLFDACTGTKTEWAFDFTGRIYACTATVGKDGEELGTFYPVIKTNRKAIEAWGNRDILSIPKCKTCSVNLVCGGGCAAVAKNQNGDLNSHDCRPVKELLKLGFGSYYKE
jgi:uncharacterized protein